MDENGVQIAKYESLAEFNEEWTDYEEPKGYWFIIFDGTVLYHRLDNDKRNNIIKDENLTLIGNHFETKEEAEKAVEKLKAWKRLKDKGFKFYNYTALGCGEIHFMLDWEDIDEKQLKQDLDLLFGGKECS